VAATEADVLIEGATGTGKELAARALHEAGERAGRPFVQINCAALPAGLIESELFGHEAGAFPGATRARFGKFEHARGGTVFLDEIDSLPLQRCRPSSCMWSRTGRSRALARTRRCRSISASWRRPSRTWARGGARGFPRRSALPAERGDDPDAGPGRTARGYPAIVPEAAGRAFASAGRPMPEVPPDTLGALSARDWPGHVRELRNAAERIALGLDIDARRERPRFGHAVRPHGGP
jgi:two-component system C4-dicarboxylate transport response regulator DctD